jgi:hypothetical protein
VLWRQLSPRIAQSSQYRFTPDTISITPPPPWIRSNIKEEALRDAGLTDSLSVLDDWDIFSSRIKEAFEFHPWVFSVHRITRRLPSGLDVELKYRKPVAAVESSDANGVVFLPVDELAIRLPESDFTEIELRYLPRISGAAGRPLVGDTWVDARVTGGAQLAAALADIWQQLRLVEILAHRESNSQHEPAPCAFEVVTSGGTRIVWGAAPGQEAAAHESSADEKRKRLLEYAAKHGRLDSIDGPAILDIRTELIIQPRTARKSSATRAKILEK